ncbi:hypothetical protein HJC23_004277 [Cyclotella cryptica]|uniref:Uncharacterized protein n=1 Tax=Cyclotella cryptica TaxID=29204 RepID=A0ABD3Q3U2_9STRA|eukprot:CCRYP_008881-RA/>CCRYP_008881-RA protein AED:0.08 eAED:0.08 QI:0/-1/0/1/-1/1/1/0/504
MSTAKWGYLQPLLRNDANKKPKRQSHDLALPGSFGREELIRPFLDTCSCRNRPHAGRGQDGLSPAKIPRCGDCSVVRSLAAFIPRKNLLRFSYPSNNNVNSDGLVVEISGNNATQLVRFHSAVTEKGRNDAGNLMVVRDMDEISLHREGLGTPESTSIQASPSGAAAEPSLVRFRVVRVSRENTNEADCNHPLKFRCVDSITDNIEVDTNDHDKNQSVILPLNAAVKVLSEKEDCIDSSAGVNVLQSSLHVNMDKNEGASDPRLPCEVVGTNKEMPRKLDDTGITDKSICAGSVESALLEKHDYVNNSDTDEESAQTESAPLSLPVNFFASSPKSFPRGFSQTVPSPTRQKSQVRIEDESQVSNQTTPQKSNLSLKRKFTSECDNELPKNEKASITSMFQEEMANERSKISVPISSLTSDQLRRLLRESNDIDEAHKSSVRKAALSLTVAMTSDASAWDLSFLKWWGETGRQKVGATGADQAQKWMPRLLQGTNIVMHKHNVDS